MSKPALRFLALGFLISAIVLAGYRLFINEPQATAKNPVTIETKDPSKEDLSYKEKYEQLLAETEVAELTKENSESSESSKESEPEEKATESAKPEATKATITVNDGDPASVAVQQIKNQGIVKDAAEFETFLEQNNYISLIRPGTYELSSEMDFQQIADKLMNR